MCSEASFMKSGFGIYANQILSRLHKTGKYEIAEFASYGFTNDPRDVDIHWAYYANAVRDNDARAKEYGSRPDNQFGRWRFEKVLIDFKPDVVIDVRDYWMTAYQGVSPLRQYFHWILMPTVDSAPQQEDWIDTFLSADAIFTYSDWGAEVLKKQSSNKINYIDTTSPGVDLESFKILDQKTIRQKYNIPQDAIVFGSVMRNQKRKLFPEICVSFRKLLDRLEVEDPELGKNIYWHFHTSYPDMGWDIPELLKDNRLANRILFTYCCKNCKNVESSIFNGPQKICSKCLQKSSTFPSVSDGVSSSTLGEIYNLFDLYVQYAICEGFGMPQVEAGACGIPIATVDYSAMCDIVKKLEAYPIKIAAYFKELETKAIRVYPDNDDLVEYLIKFISLPKPIRDRKRIDIRKLTETHYNWDHISAKWEKYLDQLDASGYRSNWVPISYLPTFDANKIDYKNIPQANHFDFMLSLCSNSLKNMNRIQSMELLNMLRDFDYGFSVASPTQIKGFSTQQIMDHIQTLVHNHNESQKAIHHNIKIDEDFISYARMKAST